MSFSIEPSTLNAQQGTVAEAVQSGRSTVSANSTNTLGYQTLMYSKKLTLSFTTGSNPQTAAAIVGQLPTNCLIYSTVCYSDGLTGVDGAGAVLVSGDTTNTNLTLTVNGLSTTSVATVLNTALPYPSMVTGEFNPKTPTSPFVASLRTPAAPVNLQLAFSYASGSGEIATLTGTVYVKVSLQQMDPNNLSSDGYPTGGIRAGPAIGTSSLVYGS